jgi:hypothetical protein
VNGILQCGSPLLAHGRSHGRRPWRPVTGSKPASRKAPSSIPIRRTTGHGARRAGHQSFSLIATASGHHRGVEPAVEIDGGRRASSTASPARRSASRSMPATCRAPRRAVALRQDRCRWCDRPRGPRPPAWRRESPARRSNASRSMTPTCRAPASRDSAAITPLPPRPLQSACRERQKVPRPCTTARRGACLGAGARGP